MWDRSVWLRLVTAAVLGLSLAGCGNLVSTKQEVALGEQQAPVFIKEGGGLVPDPQVQQYVTALGRKLVAAIPPDQRRDVPFEFFVLNNAEINAFTLPGGKVFVTRGILEKLHDEASLAAVLGHEIGHVQGQHIGKQMTRQEELNAVLGAAGAVSGNQWVNVLGGVGGQLYLLKYSRGQELEADRYGLRFMTRAGYDPQGMIEVMKMLQSEASSGHTPAFLSTHPDPKARLKQAQELIRTKYAADVNNPQFKLDPQSYAPILAQLRQLPPAPKTQQK